MSHARGELKFRETGLPAMAMLLFYQEFVAVGGLPWKASLVLVCVFAFTWSW